MGCVLFSDIIDNGIWRISKQAIYLFSILTL